MPFSATVTFDDGSTHTYDEIPDGTTSADTASRVARDYPGKSIASLMRETPAAPAAEPSFIDKAVSGTKDFVQKHGRELAGVAGSTVGGIIAAPAAVAAGVPTAGLGGLAAEAAGLGLGGTIGTQLYDRLTGRKQTLLQQAGSAAQDFATNAAAAPVGRVIGAAANMAVPTAGKVLAAALGKTSGLGKGVDAAYSAGREGGIAAKSFKKGVSSSEPPIKEALTDASAKLKAGYDARNLHYQTKIAPISKDIQQIPFDPIDAAIVDQSSTALGRRGQVKNPEAAETIKKITAKVAEYKKKNWNTPGDLDDLKQTVGNIRSGLDPGSPAFRAADQVYSAVEKSITEAAPDYAKLMADYSNATDVLTDIRRGLSLGNKASSPTQIARLVSALKATTETGAARSQLLGNLAGTDDKTLIPMLAGIASRPVLPRGLGASTLTMGEILAGMATHGNLAATAGQAVGSLAFSPRLVGSGAFVAGKGAALGNRLLSSVPKPVRSGAALISKPVRNAILADALSRRNSPQQEQAQ